MCDDDNRKIIYDRCLIYLLQILSEDEENVSDKSDDDVGPLTQGFMDASQFFRGLPSQFGRDSQVILCIYLCIAIKFLYWNQTIGDDNSSQDFIYIYIYILPPLFFLKKIAPFRRW